MELMSKPKKILVLDNGGRMLPVVDEILTYSDFDIHIIYDAGAICERAKSIRPDLIILDYLLLNNECELICGDLKQEVMVKDIPVIIVTGYRTKKLKSDIYHCDALFLKPIDMEVLASRIDYLIAS